MKSLLTSLLNQTRTAVGKGRFYEALAGDYLHRQGLRDFRWNVYSRYGEIDLVARDGNTLVFIEVRYRRNCSHGSPIATVNTRKQQKIIRTAQYFLQKNGLTNKMPSRFDVIGITDNDGTTEIRWIKNAFQ